MPVCIRGAVQFNERTSATTVRGGTPVFDRQCSVIGAKKRRRYRGMTAASSLQRLRRAVRLLGSNAIAVLLPALLHDSAVLFMTLCLFVCLSCLSVTSRCSIETSGRIELIFGMEASFDLSYTVF